MRVIPGNHDYGEDGNHADIKNFDIFKRYFAHFHNGNMDYPNKDPMNGHLFVGFNSMEEYSKVNFARGKLGDEQIQNACDFIERQGDKKEGQKVIVCLHHHPFLFPDEGVLKRIGEKVGHCLEDSANFLEKIKNQGVDILLFGHDHRHLAFTNTEINTLYKIPYIFSAGKSTEKGYEYKVKKDGTADIPAPTTIADVSDNPYIQNPDDVASEIEQIENEKWKEIPYGLFGRLIEINDDGGVASETITFAS